MKVKRRLKVDSDNQHISPGVLIDSASSTNKQSQSELGKDHHKQENIFSYDPIENYLISVLEPNDHSSANTAELHVKEKQTNRKLSLNYPNSHQNSSSKSMSIMSSSEEGDLCQQLTRLQKKSIKKKKSCKLLFESNNILQGIVRGQKIQNLKRTFLRKIRRTSTLYPPVSLDRIDHDDQKEGLLNKEGVEMNSVIDIGIQMFSVIQIFSLLVIYSVSLVYEDLLRGEYPFIDSIQILSFVFYMAEIILNLVTVKYAAGMKIAVIKDIVKYYMKQNFWIDCICAIILFVDIASRQSVTGYFRMMIILKLPQSLQKIEKIEVYFIRNVYNEQYWEMAKVFIVNFCYAHIITLFLTAMAGLSEHNWMTVKGISQATWLEKYVWSYYWATNIMLTVGFGDIAAVNYKEATCVIFIQTFSCIIMAYNINRVGSIITNIRQEDMNRSKKFKIFKKLIDQNSVSEQLTFKINNYIEQSSKIKKKFNYEEDQQFLKELPENLRVTYLKEANKQVLNKLVFFRSLLERTLCNFSELLQTKISHPQEIIRSLDDDFNLIILKKGRIGYICKKNGCGFNDKIADEITITSRDEPFLTSLDFISKVRPQYQIKSLQFSVLFKLDYLSFIQIFRKSDMDYELFCFLRDKCRNIPDQFEVMPCEFCKSFNHFKFTCPRLHYVPYEQHIIDKQLYKEKTGRNERKNIVRQKPQFYKPMDYYKKVKGYREDMVKGRTRSNFDKHCHNGPVLQSTLGYIKSYQKFQEPSSFFDKESFTCIQRLFDEKARQVIQVQLLKKDKMESFRDEVWNISLDIMGNYNSYFSQDNPKYLEQKFSKEARMSSKKLRFKNRVRPSISQDGDDIDIMVQQYKFHNSNLTELKEDIVEENQ